MNYYEHHLGDYAEATAHLSFVEDAAYSRCIRKYYASEKPLPSDVKAVQRLIGARSKEEREAVEVVLKEFFILLDDGWHNERCDEEIEHYLAGEPEREEKRANKDARVKRHREERARLFQLLRDAGHTAPWNASIAQLRNLLERTCNAPVTQPVTLQVPLPVTEAETPVTASQSPVPNHQSPVTSIKTPYSPPDDVLVVFEHWQREWCHPDSKLDEKRDSRIRARLKTFTAQQLCDAISGFKNSDWHTGLDPKGGGKVYDKIETLLREDSQVEEGIRLLLNPPHRKTKAQLQQDSNVDAGLRWLQESEHAPQ
jgi:uncharacterized protein YdaU (DUF1376 family)